MRYLFLLLCLSLAACATLEPAPTGPIGEAFHLSGRVAVKYGTEAASGKISWQHDPGSDELLLSTPLGQGVARIVRSDGMVSLTTSDHKQYQASDVESLTEQVLGWRLPLAGLPDWVRGRAAPGTPAQTQAGPGATPGRVEAIGLAGGVPRLQGRQRRAAATAAVARRCGDPPGDRPMAECALRSWQDTWPAPAKLNLFLHVTGRRADGYHSLQTAFRLIDLSDSLRFKPRADGALVLARPLPGVAPEA